MRNIVLRTYYILQETLKINPNPELTLYIQSDDGIHYTFFFFFGNVQTSTLRKELKANNMLTVYTEGLWSYSFELIASYKHS